MASQGIFAAFAAEVWEFNCKVWALVHFNYTVDFPYKPEACKEADCT
jgi:hypothetical protein